ncbi:MAG: glycosyltransferase family 2 protein [Burkholderiales bacterium]|nr:glycosyltransferase family 2 protein [Burkholderiales bacterium]
MPTNKVGLSICIPVYNKAALIGGMMDSILRQNIPDLEVIAVNNGSLDDSQKILESWQDKLDLKIYTIPRTISAPDNWLLALSLGTREFLKLQLADDIIPDGSIAAMLDLLIKNDDLGFVVGNTYMADSNGTPIRDKPNIYADDNRIRSLMPAARTLKQKARLFSRQRVGGSLFGDPNPLIFRSSLLPHLRCGVNKYASAFQMWPDYEMYLRLFAAANAGYLDIPASYVSMDNASTAPKLRQKSFRMRAWDMNSANSLTLLLLDPDLKPFTRELGLVYYTKCVLYQTARLFRILIVRSIAERLGLKKVD